MDMAASHQLRAMDMYSNHSKYCSKPRGMRSDGICGHSNSKDTERKEGGTNKVCTLNKQVVIPLSVHY